MADRWPQPDEPLTASYWADPYPDWQGMLSSDLIAFYNEAVGGMIGPWDDNLLKPASYELTLGPHWVRGADSGWLTEEEPWLEIPSNSIVFVSMGQWVRLPHYIAARFDLAIEFIYQGILLGTGPQVDPGFQGYLSCPLHNISSDAVHLEFKKPFAKMDFSKTSGLRAVAVAGVQSEEELQTKFQTGALLGHAGEPVRIYKEDKRWRPPIVDPGYADGRKVTSSVRDLSRKIDVNERQVREFGNEIRQLRRFGLASGLAVVIAVAGLLLALAQLDRGYTDAKVSSLNHGHAPSTKSQSQALRNTEDELASLRLKVAALIAELRRKSVISK